MFAIAVNKDQYETYTLTDDSAESKLEVVPERGGIITGWQVKGKEILYLDAERFANPALSVRGGIPILFPICGNLPNNTYTYQNQAYTLKQHGFARDAVWVVSDQVTEDKASLTLNFESNEETRAVYPFDFKLAFSYTIKGNSLEIFQRYTNLSEETMPFCTGLHPYFLTPDKSQLRFEIPALQYIDQIKQTKHSYHGHFDLNPDELDLVFPQITGLAANFTDNSRQLRVTVSYSSAYSTLVFWTIKGKDYCCIEPWSAPRNALNVGKPLIKLEPGASCETIVRLSVTFF